MASAMPLKGASFSYPPLPTDVDGLRILSLAPASFRAPLACTLSSVPFSKRPKYVALSYTWGSSYADNSRLPISFDAPGPVSKDVLADSTEHGSPRVVSRHQTISSQAVTPDSTVSLTVNNEPFQVRHNLHLALLHLRSPTHPISLWVDAICINQADLEERNWQVSLMSFIYKRATMVVGWLGIKSYQHMKSDLTSSIMFDDYRFGKTQQLAGFISGENKMQYSAKPNQETIVRIAESAYWTRLWIVQEVCLPKDLVLVYGSDLWAYDDFRQLGFLSGVGQSSTESVTDVFGPAKRLLRTREKRHTSIMTLESLIERFATSECRDLKDRVYGFLGCAIDIHPVVGNDMRAEALGKYIKPFKHRSRSSSDPRRGMGFLKVDYSSSFDEIWTRVICFVFFQANEVTDRVSFPISNRRRGSGLFQHSENYERRISIVRTAGVIQNALGQRVEGKFAGRWQRTISLNRPMIRTLGYVAGEIVRLGPKYSSLVGSYSAQQEWTSCWLDHYQRAEDLETLRQLDEEYMHKILHYEENNLDRVQSIRDPEVTACLLDDYGNAHTASRREYIEVYRSIWSNMDFDEREPRICLGTGYVLSLVPPAAKVGDIIVRFWNCNAALVMRPTTKLDVRLPYYLTLSSQMSLLIGRADVAEVFNRKATPGRDLHAEECFGKTADGAEKDSKYSGPIFCDLSLRTLQKVTAAIDT